MGTFFPFGCCATPGVEQAQEGVLSSLKKKPATINEGDIILNDKARTSGDIGFCYGSTNGTFTHKHGEMLVFCAKVYCDTCFYCFDT